VSARRVAVVTGTRAEFGLLTPVMRAIAAHADLELVVIAAGAHLVGDEPTMDEVAALFEIAARVPMQEDGVTGRHADGRALGRGVSGFVDAFERTGAEVVLVLGDRIEAFGAASAASVMGVAVAHLHGGDVAEGVADEAMRHAITKLAHLHFPATPTSAACIARMGESDWRIRVVGSPGADVMRDAFALDDEAFRTLGAPEVVVLHHPCGLGEERESTFARAIAEAIGDARTLWLAPNGDAGREDVMDERRRASERANVMLRDHLEHRLFTGLIKRLARDGGVLVGNSSCALIEAALAGTRAVDIGPRQGGRERCANVVHVDDADADAIARAINAARALTPDPDDHPYGDGRTGERIADALASIDFSDPGWLRKRSDFADL
jgi:UDP-hydrolysing UDP-N-acetyl-D-glucosamine 2-epimerase